MNFRVSLIKVKIDLTSIVRTFSLGIAFRISMLASMCLNSRKYTFAFGYIDLTFLIAGYAKTVLPISASSTNRIFLGFSLYFGSFRPNNLWNLYHKVRIRHSGLPSQ